MIPPKKYPTRVHTTQQQATLLRKNRQAVEELAREAPQASVMKSCFSNPILAAAGLELGREKRRPSWPFSLVLNKELNATLL